MVDNGPSGHKFNYALVSGLRYKLDNYLELPIRRWVITVGGHQLKGAGQGLLLGHTVDAQGLKRPIELSVLVVPGLGWNLFLVKQDGALPGGAPLAGTPEDGKPRKQPTLHEELS